jgi:nicotinamide-nucleotide amidase
MTFFPDDLIEQALRIITHFSARSLMVSTAESCTGGLVSALLTEIAGSSAVVDRGFVTYSNEAKQDLLGVPAAVLAAHGAVSEPTARAMAEGALARSRAHVTVAITGVAGPGGGSAEKPVGLVHFGCARRGGETQTIEKRFGDLGRTQVRRAALLCALDLLEGRLL